MHHSVKFKLIYLVTCLLISNLTCAGVSLEQGSITNNINQNILDSTNIYSLTSLAKREAYLAQLATNLSQYKFVALEAGNTTPAAWMIQDELGKNIALLKCTAGNNYAQAEVASYYLGKMLSLPLYPVTIGINVNKTLADKLKLSVPFCALKEWLNIYSIMRWKSQANLEKIVKKNEYSTYQTKNTFLSSSGDRKKLADTLLCHNNLLDIQSEKIELTSGVRTKNGSPLIDNRPTYFVTNKVSLIEVAKDFSNLMVVDAVIGNGDRFPGGNLEFRSSDNQAQKINDHVMMILNPRLSSLDTGLSFKGWPTTWARQEMTYYLRRFDPTMICRLQSLLEKLNHLTPADMQGEWNFLNFNTQMNKRITAVAYLKTNIKWVLDFVDTVKKQKNIEYIPGKKQPCNQIWL